MRAGRALTTPKASAIGDALEALLSGACDAAPRRFAQRYARFDPRRQRQAMLTRALELLSPPRIAGHRDRISAAAMVASA